MKQTRRLMSLALLMMLVTPLVPASAGPTTTEIIRNPGNPSYIVSLRGNATGSDWRGRESISFTNLEAEPLSRIWIRLWSNGVRGCGAQAIVVSKLSGGSAGGLSRNCTAFPVDLDSSVPQGGRTTISMHVSIVLPNVNDRFGYHDGLALLGTALPTLAVRDDLGWHLDPFINIGESFYSIVGNYQVTLNVPRSLHTPTTGVAVSSQTDGRRRVTTYEARRVRDFEWAAGRLSTVRGRSGNTQIVVSYRPWELSREAAETALGYSVRSLDTYSAAFGTFPYPEMDVVLAGFRSFGGMEYPTIIFSNPGKITLSHELGHQYWFGIIGNNQFASPWLDESFATWTSYLPFGGWKRCVYYRWPSPTARISNDMAYWFTHQSEYDTTYSGGGCMLANLADLFGMDRFVRALRDYAQAHWFGVTRTEDFQAVIEAAAIADGVAFDPAAYWAHWRVDS
jgi:hypothetical protein